MNVMECQVCGKAIVRKSRLQKYCAPCSEVRDLERKKIWARENPPSKGQAAINRKHTKERHGRAVERGQVISDANREGIAWMGEIGSLLWLTRISLPFEYAFSKNHTLSMNRRGHVFLREEHRRVRDGLRDMIVDAVRGRRIAHNKVWIDIFVQKPNHKGDAVNVIDGVCDALKEALGVDDRWFCIRRLDWQVVKSNPMIFIGIGQESDVDCQVCSICGRILPFENFTKAKHGFKGIGRECKECRNMIRRTARKAA